jgi:hypothetical protein
VLTEPDGARVLGGSRDNIHGKQIRLCLGRSLVLDRSYAYFRRIGYTSVFIGYLADAAPGERILHLAPRGSCASDGVLRPTGPGSPASRVGGGVCAHHDAPPTCSMRTCRVTITL